MSIGKKTTDLTDAPMEASRRKSNRSRAMLVWLCLVILATGISLLFIIRSSHQLGAEQTFAKEAANSPAAGSAVPGSPGAPGQGDLLKTGPRPH